MSFRETYNQIEELAQPVTLRANEQAFIKANPHLPLSLNPGPLSPAAATIKTAVDECADLILETFKSHGLKVSGTDPIERVVEALARFAVESGNEF